MSNPAKLAAAITAGPLPQEPFIAALPMYDWPEVRAEVDAKWAAIRDALRKKGVDAPEHLTRRNAGLPPVPGGIKDGFGKVIAPDPSVLPPDEFDLAVLWRHPNLLLSQTCWGPLELWLKGVRVVGQEDYSEIEGGEGEMYSSAIVMRQREAPPSVLSDISPARGEISSSPPAANFQNRRLAKAVMQAISPLVGEMPIFHQELGRTERGASLQTLLAGLRLAFNAPDSLSGVLALERDLAAQASGLQIFRETIQTGGHRASLRAVAEGTADVAAVDCKSWALALRHEPAAQELAVVGWTARRKGLPLISGLPFAEV
jgi:ABC-type phosphate/phosphonate transport system substrate-binding protein